MMFHSGAIVAPAAGYFTEECLMSRFAAVETSEADAVLEIAGERVKCALP
jgi:hypothetical protein